MKKILVLLLVCVLVFSIMVSMASCRNKNQEDTTTPETPATENPDQSVDGAGGTNGKGIPLTPVPAPGATPTPEE